MRSVWMLALAAVAVPLVGAAVLAAPPTRELMIELMCRNATHTQDCMTRMRAKVQVWASWSAFDRRAFDRANYWYHRREEQYRSPSQSAARRTPIPLESH